MVAALKTRCGLTTKEVFVATLSDPSTELSHCAGLLALELDTEQSDPNGIPPTPLDVATATALAGHLAKDLERILGRIDPLGLILVGALYDQTEILRPGFPLTKALATLYNGSSRSADFKPQLIALGSDRGFFPVAAINPLRRAGSGPLLLLPFCFVGPANALADLARLMEDILLQSGEVSQATREAIQQMFRVKVLNVSFATLSDLCALLRVQLESNELLPLWRLLEHGWFEKAETCTVTLEQGNLFIAEKDDVHTLFYTFDDWAQFGPGRDLPVTGLGSGYGAWTRAQRQYTLALELYGVHVRAVLANPQLTATLADTEGEAAVAALRAIPCLSGDFLVEAVFQNDSENKEQHLLITHQVDPGLGTLAYTVTSHDAAGQLLRLEHHYPLTPAGLQVIIDRLRQRCTEQDAQRRVVHPGQLAYSENGRSLRSATETDVPVTSKLH